MIAHAKEMKLTQEEIQRLLDLRPDHYAPLKALLATFVKGPLGWAVIKDSKPVGLIRKTRDGYQVSVTGCKPGDGRQHLFPTLKAAKGAT
jgi:hypothetical protein